ncbi:MAG: leucine-rich repeat protein [Spirochaetia bacterium]|nr:leucine-rich repeat protein [Spirochaetia bacterium]
MKRILYLLLALSLVLFSGMMLSCSSGGGGGGDDEQPNYLCFTNNTSMSTITTTISAKMIGALDTTPRLEYSTDGENWNEFILSTDTTDGTVVTLLDNGGKVYLRAKDKNNTFSTDMYNYIYFIMTGSTSGDIAASGSIMSLLDKSCQSKVIPCDACFLGLFSGCSNLTSAPELPATTLTNECYAFMFFGCSSLTSAPELPAKTLAEYCYGSMFSGCSSLTSAPELPATTLAEDCYYCMFKNCSKLTSTPELPVTTLAEECYYSMFSGCSGLTSAPALPATTLARSCYYEMFKNCSKLTSAPVLPATTVIESCYAGMFSGCSSLNRVEVKFTSWTDGVYIYPVTTDWLEGVPSEGTFICPGGLSKLYDDSHIPSDWTVNP